MRGTITITGTGEDDTAKQLDERNKFAITNTKFYVPVVTLSTEDNAKLLER